MSPYRLFVAGALRLQRRGIAALDFFEARDEMYGTDDSEHTQDDYTVYVPPNCFELTDDFLSQLRHTVDPLAQSNNYGIELYLQTLAFLHDVHGP